MTNPRPPFFPICTLTESKRLRAARRRPYVSVRVIENVERDRKRAEPMRISEWSHKFMLPGDSRFASCPRRRDCVHRHAAGIAQTDGALHGALHALVDL